MMRTLLALAVLFGMLSDSLWAELTYRDLAGVEQRVGERLSLEDYRKIASQIAEMMEKPAPSGFAPTDRDYQEARRAILYPNIYNTIQQVRAERDGLRDLQAIGQNEKSPPFNPNDYRHLDPRDAAQWHQVLHRARRDYRNLFNFTWGADDKLAADDIDLWERDLKVAQQKVDAQRSRLEDAITEQGEVKTLTDQLDYNRAATVILLRFQDRLNSLKSLYKALPQGVVYAADSATKWYRDKETKATGKTSVWAPPKDTLQSFADACHPTSPR